MAEVNVEWRSQYPEGEWSHWTPYMMTGTGQVDATVRLMVAEANRPGGPDHQLYRLVWGRQENEIRVVRSKERSEK